MSYSQEQMDRLTGEYRIKCVKAGGYTMTKYGGYTWGQDEEQNLLESGLPDTLRAGTFSTAKNMCEDTTYELAQGIVAGHFEVVNKRQPDHTVLQEAPAG